MDPLKHLPLSSANSSPTSAESAPVQYRLVGPTPTTSTSDGPPAVVVEDKKSKSMGLPPSASMEFFGRLPRGGAYRVRAGAGKVHNLIVDYFFLKISFGYFNQILPMRFNVHLTLSIFQLISQEFS